MLGLAVVAFVAAAAARAASPGGLILFTVDWPRTFAAVDPAGPTSVICGVDVSGRSYRLTSPMRGQQQSEPSWSPDGAAFAYAVEGRVAASGTDVAIAVRSLGPDYGRGIMEAEWPAWSPQGGSLAFQWPPQSTGGPPPSLYVGGLDGSGRHAVAAATGPFSWSPDGTQLAYGGTALHVVGSDGSGDRVIFRDTDPVSGPAWSPDGGTIAFTYERGRLSLGELTLISPDGSGRRALAPGLMGMWPAWSPDGSLLAFVGAAGVSVVAADGSGVRALYPGGGGVFGGGLDWQPVAHPELLDGLPPCAIFGDSGHHVLTGSRFGDVIYGTEGRDRIGGGAGNDVIEGGGGADVLTGGAGRELISGGTGDDRILVRDGARDVVYCGPGRDTVVVDALDSVARDCERVLRPKR